MLLELLASIYVNLKLIEILYWLFVMCSLRLMKHFPYLHVSELSFFSGFRVIWDLLERWAFLDLTA